MRQEPHRLFHFLILSSKASGSARFYIKKMRKRSSLNQILKLLLLLSFASFSGETGNISVNSKGNKPPKCQNILRIKILNTSKAYVYLVPYEK